MPSRLYTPGAPLSHFVKCFWYWHGEPKAHTKERLMPNGEPAVIFSLSDHPIRTYECENLDRCHSYGHAVLSGARTKGFVIDTIQQECTFGIEFQPGGAFPFFREPAAETQNASVALDCFWGSSVGLIREQLLAARTSAEMFAAAERELMRRLARPLALHPAVVFARREICAAPHVAAIRSVVEQTGFSQRRFIELFHRQVGLTPKAFCRVRRFQRVLQSVHGAHEAEWAQVALDCGYYDQAHLNHDFRAFSGVTPTDYLKRATRHLNHLPVA